LKKTRGKEGERSGFRVGKVTLLVEKKRKSSIGVGVEGTLEITDPLRRVEKRG